jgi:molybdopterin converting factor small subunit
MRVRVLAFARVRELLGDSAYDLELPGGSTAGDAWNAMAQRADGLRALANSTRIARNGRVVALTELLHEGDELALLPPAGGG